MPIAVATATDFSSHGTAFFVGAVGACIAPIVVTTVTRSHPVPFYLAAFGGLPALTLLQADTGGAASGYSVLMMMAMIWFGLQATDRELVAGVFYSRPAPISRCCFSARRHIPSSGATPPCSS